ncbi:abnormal spindle-like microcephaly-associated protein homolog [Gigantopelta aegis]|uniref:abnormal spindle-like microcephaly-associated protein homolog n=1 Tax=Gigantopelta aegis TaxID=1735272 RepID=UPI001B88A250|nr:abnormal spindle-like microcephaly-associated protein homolog [Gigantopelta aegis]
MALDLSNIQNTWDMLCENADEQKENKTPVAVRKSGRKSWFETPRSAKLEIAVERKKRRSPGKRRSEEMETLLLTHFTNPPHIDFGKVKVTTSRTRHMVLKNPHEYEQEVVIEKFPYKKKFSIDETKYVVGPEDSIVISITWCPEENGKCREMVLFKIDGLYRLQAFVLGTAEPPKQARKSSQRKGILGAKVKRPFSILHTPGLACIRDNYSPQETEEKPRWRPLKESANTNPDQPNLYHEKSAVFSPPTMESTIISKPAGSETSRSVKMSDLGCSPSLLKSFSPIAHASDENCLLDTYCAARHASPLVEVCINDGIDVNVAQFSKCEPKSKLVFETPSKDTAAPNTQVKQNDIGTDCNDADIRDTSQTGYNIQHSTKYLSPETFLNDSLSLKSKQTDGVQPSQLFLPAGDMFATVVVSPNSFLEDLNASKYEAPSKRFSEIPSPSSVLNDSIPHDVMLKRLSTVRTSLIGRNKSYDELTLSPKGKNKVNLFQSEPELVSGFSHLRNDHSSGGNKKSLSKNILRKEDRFTKIPCTQSPRRTTFLVKKNKTTQQHVKHSTQTNSKTLSRTQKYTNIHKAGVKGKKGAQQSTNSLRENIRSDMSSVDDSLVKTPLLNMSGSETVTKIKHNGTLNLSGSETVTKVRHNIGTLNLSGSETVTKIKPDDVDKSVNRLSSLSASKYVDSPAAKDEKSHESAKPFTIATTDGKVTSVKRLFASKQCSSDSCEEQRTDQQASDTKPSLYSEASPNTCGSPRFFAVTDIGSLQPLPDTPNFEVSKRTTHTVFKLRPSDALLQANNNRAVVNKQLFENERSEMFEQVQVKAVETHIINLDPTVATATYCKSKTEWSAEVTSRVLYERMSDHHNVPDHASGGNTSGQCSGSSGYVSPAFRSPSRALPSSPVIENCRRSTHVIAKPKLLNLNASPRRLFPALFDKEPGTQVVTRSSSVSSSDDTYSINLVESHLVQSCHTSDHGNMESTRIDSCPDTVVTPPCVSIITNDGPESTTTDVFVHSESSSKTNFLPSYEKQESKSSDPRDMCTREKQHVDQTRRRKVTASRRSSEFSENKSASVSSPPALNVQAKNACNSSAGEVQNNRRTALSDFKKKKSDLKPAVHKPVQKRALGDDSQKADKEQNPCKQNKTEPDSAEARRKKGLLWRLTSGKKKQPSKVVAHPKLILMKQSKTGVPKHPMPYAAKNMYYDERWKDKQDRGFVKWLNFILTPSDEYNYAVNKTKVDVGSLCVDGNKDGVCNRAPTKEVLSFRAYAARRRLNRLRRAACRLYQSEQVIPVIIKIEAEVEKLGLAVRKDRMLHADIGIKQRILDMLLCYNPLWLRIGLETVFGEILPLQSNSDIVGMSRYILCRLVDSPDLAREFSHPTVPHLYRNGYAEAVAQHTLKKFLLIVFFLDRAKTSRLIDHDPCLFCKDADIKASRDLLVCFSRDYLSGEGDVTRHLSYLGYTVSHVQTALDEFDYSVTKLGVDLRDGFRLMRVFEFLTGEWNLVRQLRGPAISRLQKMHNVNVVFKKLADRGLDISQVEGGKISACDIVDGHREKTLKLLWYLIFNFQVDVLINQEELTEEIKYLERSLRMKISMQKLLHVYPDSSARRDSGETDLCMENERLSLLLQWCRVVCLHYGVKIENFTVSFSDGRALCCLVHHYHPSLLPLDEIQLTTGQTYTQRLEDLQTKMTDEVSVSQDDDTSFTDGTVPEDPGLFESLLDNERKNFKLLYEKMSELGGVPLMLKSTNMSNTIPDEKVVITYVTYLCSRLLDIRHESRAARVIQLAWRRLCLRRALRVRQKEDKAAKTLQTAARQFLKHKKLEREKRAAALIQTAWKRHQARQRTALLRMAEQNKEMSQAAVKIQTVLKGCVARRRYAQKRKAVFTIQAAFRGYLVRRDIKKKNAAAEKIQTFYRGYTKTANTRKGFVTLRTSTLTLQRALRAHLAKRHSKQLEAAVCIQRHWRGFKDRKYFCNLRKAALVAQKCSRMKKSRQDFTKLKESTLKMQQRYRAKMAGQSTRTEYLLTRTAVCKLQAHTRGMVVRRKYVALKRSAVFMQKNFRRYKCQVRYHATRLAVVIIKRAYRNYRLRIGKNEEEKERTAASLCIQRWWRNQEQVKSEKVRNAVLRLQSCWRGYKVRQDFTALRKATVIVQSHVRGFIARRRFLKTIAAVIVLQHHVRSFLEKKHCQAELLQKTTAAVVVQRMWRLKQARRNYHRTCRAALVLQKNFAMLIARKRFLEQKRAAVVLQKHIRKFLLSKASEREKAKLNCNAIVIQSWWRGCHTCQMYSRKRRAAVVIQRQYRDHVLRKQHKIQTRSAEIIQQRFRALLAGRQARRTVCRMHQAAMLIQKNWRAFAARKRYFTVKKSVVILQSYVRRWLAQSHYQRMKKAVCVLQTRLRAHLEGKETQESYLLIRNKLIKIQAFVRSSRCRREFVAKRRAVVLIQSYVRMHQQRQDYRRVLAAACIIQMRFRQHMSALAARTSYLALRRAVVSLQSHMRRRIHSKRYSKMRAAVLKLQSFVRMRKMRQEFCSLKKAAVSIQSLYRQRRLAGHQRVVFLRQRDACLKLQRAVRGMLRRRSLRKNLAAKKIQSLIRGYLARKEFLKVRRSVIVLQSYVRMHQARVWFSSRKSAAVTIQQKYRSFLIVRKARQQFLAKRESARTVQAAYRSYLVRKMITEQRKAALQIQTIYRMYAVRKSYLQLRLTTLTMQKVYRCHRTGRKQQMLYLQQKSAAAVIQKFCRGFLARSRLRKMQIAAVKIQSAYKSHRQRILFVKLRGAVLLCQRLYRAHRISRRERRCFLMQVGAAVTIQASFRTYIARKRYLDLRRKLLLIQASVQTFLQRRKYLKLLSASKAIQARFRAHQSAVMARRKFLQVKSSVVILQTAFRRWKIVEAKRREQAAAVIQSYFRMRKQRVRFQTTRGAVVRVQSVVRGFLSRCRYRRKLQAVKLLQRNIRVYVLLNALRREMLQRRTDVKRNAAAVCIQASVRQYLQRKHFCKVRQEIIMVQSMARGYLARKMVIEMRCRRRAAITMQRIFRSRLAAERLKVVKEKRKAYVDHYTRVVSFHLAAARIQRWYRRRLVLERAREKLHSVIVIQRYTKTFLARLKFLKLRNSIVLIQRRVREWIQRRDQAAKVIQRKVVKWLLVVKQNRLHGHAAKIQAVWKGYYVRRNTKSKKINTVRIRIAEANSSATEEKKLGNRTTSALDYLLRYHQLSYILDALIQLDVATRLSPRCCKRLVEVNAVHVIYRLIQSGNRSLPHMELIKYAVNILLNLVKYDRTRPAVYDVDDAAAILVELMAVYRDKGLIFSKTCTLLGILALDTNTRNDIASQSKVVEKIQTIHFLTLRKHSIDEEQRVRRAKLAAQKTFNCTLPLPTPSKQRLIRPEWALRRNSFEGIQDPLMAINFVMENLILKPKRV